MTNKKRSPVPQMRGLGAFLSTPVEPSLEPTDTIAIDAIVLPPKQPRRYFDPDKLSQLAASIQEHGILEPLLVRSLNNGTYELVAGERRYRAAKSIGLKDVPVTVREFSDQEALHVALIENLQREDLNPVEETEGVLELIMLELSCDQNQVRDILAQMATAQKKGSDLSGNVSRQVETIATMLENTLGITTESFRTARLPLLDLPEDILDSLRQGKLEYTKARAIARIKDEASRQDLLNRAVSENLSLSQIRDQIKAINEGTADPSPDATKDGTKDATNTAEDDITRVRTRFKAINRRVQALDLKQGTRTHKRLEKILAELETLLEL